MTFTLVGRDNLSRAFREAGVNANRLSKDLKLLGAASAVSTAVTGAAAVGSLGAAFGAAAVAVGVFGAAVIPQAKAMGEVSQAQKKYADAVEESGRTSSKAAEAQLAYSRAAAKLPPATREASAALMVLNDAYQEWSDSTAADTMPVLTKSFAVFGGILPKLTPLVRGTSAELDRLMTIVAGGVASDGFGKLTGQFTEFAVGTLRKANDALIHFARTLGSFDPSGGAFGQFMQIARENGPLVSEAMQNIARALINLMLGASEVGSVLLTVANALAKIVAAIPPGVLGTLIQLYATFRLLSTVAAGVVALGAAARTLGVSLFGMQLAATGAGGAMLGLRAAFLAMSATAKASVVVAGIALLVIGLTKLSNIGQEAPPNIDRMTRSMAKLGDTGKVTGEAARVLGKDLGAMAEALRGLARPSNLEKTQQFLTSLIGMDSTPVKEWKERLDGADKALSNLVKGGNADLAESAFKRLAAGMREQGLTTGELRSKLDDYKSALADQAFEQQLAADAMGLFGDQAIATKSKLDEQKASADGLRQAIQALNDVNRAGLGGMIGFEAAIDNAAKAAKENAGALDMVNGKLNLNSEGARNAATALSDLGTKTDEAAASARESGASWETVNGIYTRGRSNLVKYAMQMGLTKSEATALAAEILKVPDKNVVFKGNLDDLEAKVGKATRDIKSVPPSKLSKLLGNLNDLRVKVENAKGQLKSVPKSKRSDLLARIDDLQRKISRAKADIASVHGKTVTIRAHYVVSGAHARIGKSAGSSLKYASGGLIGYATGGGINGGGGMLRGPGTGTSDSIPIWASNNEFMIKAKAVRHYGADLFEALNDMRLPVGTRPTSARLSGAAVTDSAPAGSTYNIYPRKSVIDADDFRLIQRQEDAKLRVRRPH